jgi:hypothetical protein
MLRCIASSFAVKKKMYKIMRTSTQKEPNTWQKWMKFFWAPLNSFRGHILSVSSKKPSEPKLIELYSTLYL